MLPSETPVPDYDIGQPGEAVSLEEAFRDLGRVITRFSEDTPLYLDANETAEAAALLLFDLREHRKRLAEIEAYVEAQTAQRMTSQTLRVPGVIVAERKGGRDRKCWEHDRLAWALTHPLAVDADGVLDPDAAQMIGVVRDRLLNCAQITGWRVTQLRPLGIDPDAYCSSEPGRRTVHVRPDTEDDE